MYKEKVESISVPPEASSAVISYLSTLDGAVAAISGELGSGGDTFWYA